jgi:TolB protein
MISAMRVVLFALLALTSSACLAPQSVPDRLVFSSYTPSNWDIYLFEGRGGSARALTTHPALDYEPTFSADGRWVVFTSERDGSPDLWAIDLTVTDRPPQRLIASDAMEDQVALSADGETMLFVSTYEGNADIYSLPFRPHTEQRMDDARNLTRHPGGDFRPSFSPDGTRIAFSSDRDTAPVGHTVFAFARQREGEVYVMAVEGGDATRLTRLANWDGSPTWSADGRTLFFYSAGGERHLPVRGAATQEGGFRIWSLDVGDPVPRAVSPEGVEALWPTVTPDGRVAFATRAADGYDARWSIVSVGADGSDLRAEGDDERSYWAPDFFENSMVVHGSGPEEDVLPGCGFQGNLLDPGYPVRRQVGDATVLMLGMRHAFSVAPHPTENRVAVQCGGPDGLRLVTAEPDGVDPYEVVRFDPDMRPNGGPIGLKWAKNGERLTYMVGPFWGSATADADVWTVRADGGDARNLSLSVAANDGSPDFSRDGSRLVFRSGRSGVFDIYLMSADDPTSARRITDDPAKDNFPVFSPTEDLVTFVSDRDGTDDASGNIDFDIYTVAVDAEGALGAPKRIAPAPGQDSHVQFSPDGEWLVFTSERGGINDEEPLVQELFFGPQMYGDIYAYRLRDGYLVRLTHNKWEDGAPFWVGPALASRSPS